MAKRGTPSVALVTEEFWPQGDFVANSLGMSDAPRLQLPHPVAGTGAARHQQLAEEIAPRLIRMLAGD
ncbi:MAG: hypothetical protein NXH85_11730 [Pseudomonadaceae bacterium]|nr:hypothetical protein [Pseudomonadaceae bacterium]